MGLCSGTMGEIPARGAPWEQVAAYAVTYNAYQRWVGSLGQLSEMLRPFNDEYEATGVISPDLGEDLLRAWLFVLVRQSRSVGAVNVDGVVVDDYRSPAIGAILVRLVELAQQHQNSRESGQGEVPRD